MIEPPPRRIPLTPPDVSDIRDRPYLQHEDIIALNFIRDACPYVFRRHFRCGLRSHILEVLDPHAVRLETEGLVVDGMRWYPKPVPLKMLRIFRKRFCSVDEVHEENRRLRVIENYVDPDQLARSNEFIVHYGRPADCDILLCGLQEYAEGHELAPWRLGHVDVMADLSGRIGSRGDSVGGRRSFMERLHAHATRFVDNIRRMVVNAGLIPDLAGERNILITSEGRLRLVDINNISPVRHRDPIYLDDKGYPVCDKSIEALSRMEVHLVGRDIDPDDSVYRGFLNPDRMAEVARLGQEFHRTVSVPC